MKDNNNFETQLSAAHEPRFGSFQSRNLYRTTYDNPKFRAGGVYNIEHRIYLDYINKESIHKVETKQSSAENSTYPYTPEYKQKRSVNISIAYGELTLDSQKTIYVGKPERKENYPPSGRNIYYPKRTNCKTKRSLGKVTNDLKGETRTRVRRSDDKQKQNDDIKSEHEEKNNDSSIVTKQSVCKFRTEELPVASIYPQYFIYTWVLCMVALASFLKLNYLVKTIVLVFMVTCYGILIISFSSEISLCYR